MNKKHVFSLALAVLSIFGFQSCSNDDDNSGTSFRWSDQSVAGTLASTNSPDRYSSYIIIFDEEETGKLITSTSEFEGTYELRNDSLIFNTNDTEKWFFFDVIDNELISSKYEVRFYNEDGTYNPAAVQYNSTFYQSEIPVSNELVGNTYVGDLYKLFTSGVFEENYNIGFDPTGDYYISGEEDHIHYETYNNIAFRSEINGKKEFGVLINGELVVSALDGNGFSYWGTFEKQ